MSLTYSGAEPQPSLAWQFESSNVDYVTNLQPSAQVSPGPAQLQGGASLVTNAPSGSNTAVSFNGTTGSYMNLGTSPVNVDITTSNIFVECWVYLNNQSLSYPVMITVGPTGGQWRWALSFNTTTLNPRLGMNSNGNNLNSSITIAGIQTWSHVAFSFNRTSAGAGTAYLFVNGQLGGSMAVTGLIYSAADTVCIAGYTNTAGYLNGYIRDLRVVQGGVVPVANFTPLASAPFSYASPTYVANMGTTVFTLLGQFITYVPGKYNQAINIVNNPLGTPNTGNNYVTYNNPLTLSATVGTSMSAWVNISKLPAVNEKSIVYGIEGTIGKLWIELYTTGTQVTMYNSTNYFNVFYGSPPSLSTWYHYAAVCDNSKLYFYLNGVLVGTPTTITAPPSFSGGYIQIGGFGYYAPLNGLVDDLRIYNTALTAAQVQSVYSSQGAPAPSRAMPLPIYAFDFENTAVPYTGSLSTGIVGTGITYQTGKYLRCIDIPNSGGFQNRVDYNYSGSYSVDSGFSVAFWVKPYTTSGYFLQFYGSAQPDGFGGGPHVTFTVSTNGKVGATLYNFQTGVAGTGYNGRESASTISLTTFTHVSATIGNGVLVLYVNGVAQPIVTYLKNGMTLSNFFRLGSADNWGPASAQYDDLRIFDRSLTSSQVQAIYNQQGVPGRGVQVATHLLSLIPSSPVFMQTFGTSTVPTSDLYGATLTSTGSPTMYLDATRGYVFPATGTTYMSSNFNLPVSYSKSVWVYLTGTPGTGNLLSSTNGGTNGVHYLYFGGAYSLLAGHNSGTSVNPYVSDPGTITLNRWTHYVLTYDNTSTTMKLYRDGSLVAQATNSAMNWTGGNAVGICQYANSNTLGNGRVDNPIIYNRALTAAEVSLLYTSQFNNPTLGETTAGLSYNPIRLTGTPLFNQLSQAARSSAVGAFSLRAVNGTSARAVQVRATAPLPSFTASATSIGSNAYSQSLTGYSFGGTGTYIATGSSIYNTGTTQPWKAFDGDATTWWETTGGLYNTLANGGAYTGTQTITIDSVSTSCEWIKIQIPTGVVLSSYSMYARSGFTYRMPKNFKIAGSNDGATWTAVDTQTNQTTWTGQTPITFTTTSSTAYKYFALCVTAITSSGGTNNLNVGQWTLNGSWQTDFYADRLGNLLTAPVTGQSLANWLGGATGYVKKWYDQSGRGNDAIQDTAAKQPIIQRATKGPGYMCIYSGTQGLNFGAYDLLNNKNYTTCGVVRRTAVPAGTNYYLCGDGGVNNTDQKFHSGYRTSTLLTLAHYSDDTDLTVPSFLTSSTEPTAYNYLMLGTGLSGRMYSYSSGTLYSTPRTYNGYLNHAVGTSFSIGGGFGTFIGEIYEILVFTQSLYDLDGTTSINQIYQNQLGAYGT